MNKLLYKRLERVSKEIESSLEELKIALECIGDESFSLSLAIKNIKDITSHEQSAKYLIIDANKEVKYTDNYVYQRDWNKNIVMIIDNVYEQVTFDGVKWNKIMCDKQK